MSLVPGLSERILKSAEQEIHYVADMVGFPLSSSLYLGILTVWLSQLTKGTLGARADDTKSLKSVILDWITPPGGSLNPPLSRNVKTDRGFFHNATGELLCPVTMDWSDEE